MGYTYYELIPAAVLFNHSGITRGEYVKFLDEFHAYTYAEFSHDAPLTIVDERYSSTHLHQGLYGLAEILHLQHKTRYREFKRAQKDNQGITIRAPHFTYDLSANPPSFFTVTLHIRNELGEPEIIEGFSRSRLGVGNIYTEKSDECKEYLIDEVLGEDLTGEEEDYAEPWETKKYSYLLKVRPISRVDYYEEFSSEQALWSKWPQFHYDFMYSWGQKKGHFKVREGDARRFKWVMENGRYYLDKENLNRIGANFIGYVDLVLTAEAIKHEAWKVFSYKGLRHLDHFLHTFPDSKAAYERAVWDAHTSLWAKKREMSYSDLMRFRITGCL